MKKKLRFARTRHGCARVFARHEDLCRATQMSQEEGLLEMGQPNKSVVGCLSAYIGRWLVVFDLQISGICHCDAFGFCDEESLRLCTAMTMMQT